MSGSGENLVRLGLDNRSFYVPAFRIFVRETPLSAAVARDVSDVTYEDGTDRVDSFTLALGNWDASARRPKYIGLPKERLGEANAKLFEPGNEIQLWMGYQDELKLMMTGFITTLDVEYPEQGVARVMVHGLNVIDRLRKQQFTWTWPDDGAASIRDSDIALKLSGDADAEKGRPGLGLKVKIDPAAQAREPSLSHVTLNNQYPIVFLLERARRNGYQVTIREESAGAGKKPLQTLYFGPTVNLADTTYVLEWGRSLQSFRPVYGSAKQLYAVTVCGWDRRTKQKIKERTTLDMLAPDECPNHDLIGPVKQAGREDIVTDQPINTIEEARKRGQSILREQQHGMVKATGATVGLPDLRAGRVVVIRQAGIPFDGRYFVTSTHHTIGEQGYRTTFEALRFGPEAGAQRPPS
jgi:phage protein D